MKDRFVPVVSIVVFVVVVLGGYFYWIHTEQQASESEIPAALEKKEEAATDAASSKEPAVRYPIAQTEGEKPLPPLAESDGMSQESLADLLGKDAIKRFL